MLRRVAEVVVCVNGVVVRAERRDSRRILRHWQHAPRDRRALCTGRFLLFDMRTSADFTRLDHPFHGHLISGYTRLDRSEATLGVFVLVQSLILSSSFTLRPEGPRRVSLYALWTSRSRIASASEGMSRSTTRISGLGWQLA